MELAVDSGEVSPAEGWLDMAALKLLGNCCCLNLFVSWLWSLVLFFTNQVQLWLFEFKVRVGEKRALDLCV